LWQWFVEISEKNKRSFEIVNESISLQSLFFRLRIGLTEAKSLAGDIRLKKIL